VLANDYLACRLARMIGLSVPEPVIFSWTKRQSWSSKSPSLWLAGQSPHVLGFSLFRLGDRRGLGLAARDNAWARQELKEFAGLLGFDKWTEMPMAQVVFHKEIRERKYNAKFIDFGYCFNAGEWSFPDAPLRGVYGSYDVYERIESWTTLIRGCRGSSDSPSVNCTALRTRSM